MTVRVGINGFGRIGRQILRRILTDAPDVDPVAINTSRGSPEVLAHLFKYDSVFGRWPGRVESDESDVVIDGRAIRVLSVADPGDLPWDALAVEVVVDSTGVFLTRETAARHLAAGAEKVVVTAPMTNEDITVVVGVNDDRYDPARHHIVSGASCTTNCLAPMAMVLDERFGIVGGLMTTVHAFTRDQELLDGIHTDLRRARSAANNVAPTNTGAAASIGKVLPHLDGRLVGIAVRVPVPDVSLVDLNVILTRSVTAEEINDAFREAACSPGLASVLGVCDEPLVSSDFRGEVRSCVVDSASTRVAPGAQAKVLAWYDNEGAYAARIVDLVRLVASGHPVPARTAVAAAWH